MRIRTLLQLSCATVTASAVLLPSLAAANTASNVVTAAAEDEDTIIVTGSPLERTVGEAAVGVSVLDSDELARQAAASLGDALRREPGISSTYFGPGASRPIIRGQGGDRIRVLDNGIGSIDAASASPDHATAVTPAMAERIEIVRGTGLLRYGSSAAGGVVNVIDGRLPMEAPEDGMDGAIRAGVSSVDDGTDIAGALTSTLGEWEGLTIVGHIGGSWRDASDIDIPGYAESAAFRAAEEEEEHGDEDENHDEDEHEEEEEARDTLENSFVETQSFSGGLGFIGERARLAIGVKKSETSYGLPGGHGHGHEEEHEDEDHGDEEDHDEDEHEEEEENVFIELEQTRFDLNAEIDLDGFFEMLSFYGGTADYEHTEFEGPGEVGTVFKNDGWEARVELAQRERDGWRGASGVQLRNRDFSAIGEEAFVPPTETEQFGLYTFQEIDLGTVTLEGAARFEKTKHTRSTDGENRSFDGVSISAGARTAFSDQVSGAVTVSRTERAPNSIELYANGPHLATNRFEIGDPTLEEEIGTSIEGSIRFDADRGHIQFNVFHTEYDGYIFERATGGEEDELPVFQFAGEDATFTGLEVEGEADLGTAGPFAVSGSMALDLVNAELSDSGDNLPLIPPLGVTAAIDLDTDKLSLRAEIEYAAEQDDVSAFELPTESYTLANLHANWHPYGGDHPFSVSVGLENAFDEEAREHTSFLKDLVPLPGRNVRFGARYEF